MKNPLLLFATSALLFLSLGACSSDVPKVVDYTDWYNENEKAFADSTMPHFETITASWDKSQQIRLRRLERPVGFESLDSMNYNSTVSCIYRGHLINGIGFDSSYLMPNQITTFGISSLIDGLSIALTKMVVGDSCRIVIPQNLGYGYEGTSMIPPLSTLVFDLKIKSAHINKP